MDITHDLANDLLQWDVWDPHNLNPPDANKIKSWTSSLLDKNIPLKQAKWADIVFPTDPEVNLDGFIDNTIVVGLYDKSKRFRLASCVPLSLYMMELPTHNNEPVHKP